MAWTDAEKRAIQNLVLRIENLEAQVADLQECCNNNNTGCSCDCKVYPHIVKVETDYFYIDENGNEVAKTPEEISIILIKKITTWKNVIYLITIPAAQV